MRDAGRIRNAFASAGAPGMIKRSFALWVIALLLSSCAAPPDGSSTESPLNIALRTGAPLPPFDPRKTQWCTDPASPRRPDDPLCQDPAAPASPALSETPQEAAARQELGRELLAQIDEVARQKEAKRIAAIRALKIDDSSKALLRKHQLFIGATPVMARLSWGAPEKVNRTVVAQAVEEQWVYPGDNYLYFDDGKLTAAQTSSGN